MSTTEEIARAYWKAEESRDVDRIMAFFAPDAEWRGPGVHLTGHDEIRGFYAESGRRFARGALSGQTPALGRIEPR